MVKDAWSIANDFVVVGGLAFLCVAFSGRSLRLSQWVASIRPLTHDSSYLLWRGLIASVLLAIILILCLIGVNSMKGAVGKLSVNIAILVLLIGDLAAMWSCVRRLRRLRD